MKTILKSVLSLGILLMVFASCNERLEERGEKEEKEEGAVALGSLNEWSAMRTYPHGKMIAEGFGEGHELMMRMNARQTLQRSITGVTTTNWQALGPMNFAGRIISLGFHPTNTNIMFAGSASGGLWKTTTGGTGAAGGINWTYVPTGFPVLGVGTIAFNPSNGDEIYIGTGEVYDNGSGGSGGANVTSAGYIRTFRGSYGVGILKSTDGGATWTKSLDFSYSGLKGVWDILIDPTNTSTVYAATTDGVYRSLNAGTSWTLIHNIPMAMDICFKPGSYATLYVGCGNFSSAGYGIYKTTNARSTPDAPTFTKLGGGLPTGVISGKIQLATTDAAPSTIYASIGRKPETSDVFGIYISTDDGATWSARLTATNIVAGTSSLNQGWYAHDIVVSPTNVNTVYWAEMEVWSSTDGFTNTANKTRRSQWNLWTTSNTTIGTTNESTGASNGSYVHADIHHLYIPYSGSPNTIFAVSDGGIYKSTNGASSWIAMNGGLQTAQIYPDMSVSSSDDNFMIAGMQDNEGMVYSGTTNSRRIGGLGDGFHTAIHPTNDNTCYIGSYYFNIRRSTNRASSFSGISSNPGLPPPEYACFNTPFVIAPSSPTTIYAGTIYFKRYSGSGTTWNNLNGGAVLSHAQAPILYIAVSPTDANLVYVSVAPGGGQRSKLFRSTNGGTSFTNITGTLPDRYYSQIALDPADHNRIAVTLSGFGSSHVYLSNNGGTNWTDIGSGLPDVPANAVMFDPSNRDIIYIGNDIGVFATNNMPTTGTPATTATNWLSYNGGFNDAVMISDLLVTSGNRLRVATYGRGIWENDLLAPASFLLLSSKFLTHTAKNAGLVNEIRWSATQQSSVSKYEIEISTDGVRFVTVGELKAKASPEAQYAYNHAVTNNNAVVYYRIKTVYITGRSEYSGVMEVEQPRNREKISMYPNPARSDVKFTLPAYMAGEVRISIFDAQGKLVKSNKISYDHGGQIYQNLNNLTGGTYTVTLESGAVKWNTKLIKVNH